MTRDEVAALLARATQPTSPAQYHARKEMDALAPALAREVLALHEDRAAAEAEAARSLDAVIAIGEALSCPVGATPSEVLARATNVREADERSLNMIESVAIDALARRFPGTVEPTEAQIPNPLHRRLARAVQRLAMGLRATIMERDAAVAQREALAGAVRRERECEAAVASATIECERLLSVRGRFAFDTAKRDLADAEMALAGARTALRAALDALLAGEVGDSDLSTVDALIDEIAPFVGGHRDFVGIGFSTDNQCPPDIRWHAIAEHLDDTETTARGGTYVEALRHLLTALRAGHHGEIMANGQPRSAATNGGAP